MSLRALLFGLATLVSLAGAAQAEGCRRPQPVRFERGASTAELVGAIPRGERDCYTITARAGQHLSVTQPGRQAGRDEGNVVMQLFAPHWRVVRTADGAAVGGRTLPGAGIGEDAPSWTGQLDASGTYLLVLGTTRGGGEYRVRVMVR